MNKQRVLQALENVKSNPYGKWGILNIEQRRFIKELCNSWLILDDATNKQTEEIERLKELSKVDSQQGQEIIIELNKEIERLNNIITKNQYTADELCYIKELEDRIDKAIDYVEHNIGKSNNHLYFEVLDEEIENFLKILKGE